MSAVQHPEDTRWQDYIEASRRKIEISRFHADRLGEVVGRDANTVEVQAHFEGVLYAFVAVCDQTAEAIHLGLRLDTSPVTLRAYIPAIPDPSIRSKLKTWYESDIVVDVLAIRRRAVHHHYKKTPHGPRLEVQLPPRRTPYGGSRLVDEYAKAAVVHLEQMQSLLSELALAINAASATT